LSNGRSTGGGTAVRALLAALAVVLVALPAAADASSVQSTGGVLLLTGDPGGDDLQIVVDAGAGTFVVKEGFDVVAAGPGCAANPSGTASCPVDGVASVLARLGDGDDSLQTRLSVPVDAAGEGGDDSLLAGDPPPPYAAAPATLDGGEGDDRLSGTSAADTLRGGPGDDAFDGQAGDDVLDLGPGADSVNDLSGDDRVEARDGTADRVDCGPGTDTAYFDAIDTETNCEAGLLPPPPVANCTPDVERPSAAARRRFARSGSLTVAAAAPRPCGLGVTVLLGGHAVTTARSAAGAVTVRVRVRGAALRRVRRATKVMLSVSGTAAGAPTRTRRLTLRLRYQR
jgi:Ca2+-binding RTX toxin-like protein